MCVCVCGMRQIYGVNCEETHRQMTKETKELRCDTATGIQVYSYVIYPSCVCAVCQCAYVLVFIHNIHTRTQSHPPNDINVRYMLRCDNIILRGVCLAARQFSSIFFFFRFLFLVIRIVYTINLPLLQQIRAKLHSSVESSKWRGEDDEGQKWREKNGTIHRTEYCVIAFDVVIIN